VRWLVYTLWALAAVAGVRALLVVPGQVAELDEYGFWDPPVRLPTRGDATLRGSIVQAWSGQPLADVELEVVRLTAGEAPHPSGRDWTRSAPRAVPVDPDGDFAIQLAPGAYRVDVVSPRYAGSPFGNVVVGEQGQSPSPYLVAVQPVCEPAVQVVDDQGAPVAGAELFLRSGDPGRAFYIRRPRGLATTGEHGEVQMRVLCGSGTLRYVALPGEPARYVEQAIDIVPDMAPVRIDAATIRGAPLAATAPSTVLDERADHHQLPGPPVPGADELGPDPWGNVELMLTNAAGQPLEGLLLLDPVDDVIRRLWHGSRFSPQSGIAVAGGAARMSGVPTGRYRPVVSPVGRAPVVASEVQRLAGEDLVGEVRVELARSAEVVGTVSGPDGPVGGAEVYLLGTGALGRLFFSFSHAVWIPRTVSAPDGSFRLQGLPPGDLVLLAYHPSAGESAPLELVVGEGEQRLLDIELLAGTADFRSGWVHGCLVDIDRDGVLVGGVIRDSRSHRLGLMPGDRLLLAGDVGLRWLERQRVYALLSGEERGFPATLTTQRPGEQDTRVIPWSEDAEDISVTQER